MYDLVTYRNSKGQEIRFNQQNTGYIIRSTDIRDYVWKVKEKANKISEIYRGVTDYELKGLITAESKDACYELRNQLHDICEYDITENQPGTLYIGDYYIKCYVTSMVKEDYSRHDDIMRFTLRIVSDTGGWIHDSKYEFRAEGSSGTGLDFPYDYDHDYYASSSNSELYNTDGTPADFQMIIYGAAANPQITIGEHDYLVRVSLDEDEHLVIDSLTKKIYRVNGEGETINEFAARNRQQYIFQKIPAGTNAVTWDGTFDFDVIVHGRRSEPRWS